MPGVNLQDLSLPNVSEAQLDTPTIEKLGIPGASTHPARILLLYAFDRYSERKEQVEKQAKLNLAVLSGAAKGG